MPQRSGWELFSRQQFCNNSINSATKNHRIASTPAKYV